MCMICAAIPATTAVGANLNAAQLRRPLEQRKPIIKITAILTTLLLIASIVYHTLTWRS